MRVLLLTFSLMAALAAPANAMMLAQDGHIRAVIMVDRAATAPEVYAARQLALNLKEMTGAPFRVFTNNVVAGQTIIVGQGEAAYASFPDVPFDQLDGEEWNIRQ